MIATQDGRSKIWRFVFHPNESPIEGRDCRACRARHTHWHEDPDRRAQFIFITRPNTFETARAMYEQSGMSA